jgi:hypothetical protein
LSVAVAVDRRPFCRADRRSAGVVVESKDSPQRWETARAADLPEEGVAGLVRRTLEGLKADAGLRVVVQTRVPPAAGLGSAAALSVAAASACARARGIALEESACAVFARHGDLFAPVLPAAGHAAVLGGVVAAEVGNWALAPQRLPVDPARVEECLLLVDLARTEPPPAPTAESRNGAGRANATALAEAARVAARGIEALLARDLGAVPDLLRADVQALRDGLGPLDHRFEALAEAVGRAGGAAVPTGLAGASLALVWAAPGARGPGAREAVVEALKAGGYRTFRCRVDLLGLEREDVEHEAPSPGKMGGLRRREEA